MAVNAYSNPYSIWPAWQAAKQKIAPNRRPYNAYTAQADTGAVGTPADFRMIDRSSVPAVQTPVVQAPAVAAVRQAANVPVANIAAPAANMFKPDLAAGLPADFSIAKAAGIDTSIAVPEVPATPTTPAAAPGLLDKMGGLSGVASAVGAGAQIYNAYNQGKYNDKMINEQKRINNMYIQEANERRAARNQFQNNINSVWAN